MQFLTKLLSNEIFAKSLFPLGVLVLLAEIVWLVGPYIAWANYTPLAQSDKRFYVIAVIFLAWLLKFLLIDLGAPASSHHEDPKIKAKLQQLQNRFSGALQFLNKTVVSRQNKSINLNVLPWHLIIGPANSGKTTLLVNSGVNFILQRQFQNQDKLDLESSEHCDWWVTRDASLIDVPGKYFSANETSGRTQVYTLIWSFFLGLIKKQRGKNGVNGIIIVLPLPEIMKQGDTKAYQALLRDLFQRVREFQNLFPQTVPCQLVITKCDLLSGFTEFFSESSNEEISQAWGITLPAPKSGQKIYDLFTPRFNALIKKLNQQLIWRLHQERNPMMRPYIKDFPLQVERLKEFIIDFMKKFSSANINLSLQGIYLTSALQPTPEAEPTILDQPSSNSRAVQLFKEPSLATRAYFIKQLLTHGLSSQSTEQIPVATQVSHWKHYTAYATAIGISAIVAIMLGRDFQQGIQQAYSIQHNISDYQLTIAQIQDPDEHLLGTLKLLDSLQQSVKEAGFKLDLSYLMSFYSHKTQLKTNEVYHQALRAILIPEIKKYFEFFLQNPINKNADDIYAVLKSYLMMGDASHFDPIYVAKIMKQIQPKIVRESNLDLMNHITLGLDSGWIPLALDTHVIQETRQFLLALPGLKLSYIILKNIDSNNIGSTITQEITLGNPSIFVNQQMVNPIPVMFTAKAFASIISQEATTAASEASAGNWVLGNDTTMIKNPEISSTLIEELRTTYINNYIDAWERLLTNIQLLQPHDLAQTDNMIIGLTSTDSPLLQLLQILHENTYFEPIATSSQKLQNLGLLLEKNAQSQNQLYAIFASLQALHQYLQPVLTAENERKAAFETVSGRLVNNGKPDPLTQLRLVAEKSPEPIKNWLDKIANDSWFFLMQDSGRYIDTSWQTQVLPYYQTDIANRYPFATNTDQEVDIKKFVQFFGNPGVILNFYNHYLRQLVDTSTSEWHWKNVDNQPLIFSDDTLRQIQHAVRIHHSFFPNGDNKLYVQFALQQYKIAKKIKKISLRMNDKQFIDEPNDSKSSHVMAWPSNFNQKMTAIQLTLVDEQILTRRFSGDWGWFRLVNQSFENMISKKEMVLNLSLNEYPAKYLLFTEGQYNPFTSLNLRHFHFSQQLTDNK